MLHKKSEFPEEGEIVLCTVTNINPNSVFVKLSEYNNRVGLIHLPEVSPGRIRNIRDFVREGKTVVCKVLRVSMERGHIDLSLRRVTESQKRAKADEIKQEQKAEKILEIVCRSLNKDINETFSRIADKVNEKYASLYVLFEEAVSDDKCLGEIFPKEFVKPLYDLIKQRIKPAEVVISGKLTLTSYKGDGIEIIRAALKKAENTSKDVSIMYDGGGKYNIKIKAEDYKDAEKMMGKATDAAVEHIEKNGSIAKFIRTD